MRHWSGIVLLATLFEGGLLVVAFALGAVLDTSPFWTLALDVTGVLWGIVATGPLLLGLAWSLRAGWPPFEQLTDQVIAILGAALLRGSAAVFVIVSLVAGIAEEALFRGVLQSALVETLGAAGAILAAGAFFGLAHAVTPLYAGLAALVGGYLGLVFHLSGNLVAPVLTHALYDFVALIWLARLARRRAGPASVPGHAEREHGQATVEAAEVVGHEVDVRRQRKGLGEPDVVADPEAE